jgi:hypothetical protein
MWLELLDAVHLYRCSIMLYARANVNSFRSYISSLYIPPSSTFCLAPARTTNANIRMKCMILAYPIYNTYGVGKFVS